MCRKQKNLGNRNVYKEIYSVIRQATHISHYFKVQNINEVMKQISEIYDDFETEKARYYFTLTDQNIIMDDTINIECLFENEIINLPLFLTFDTNNYVGYLRSRPSTNLTKLSDNEDTFSMVINLKYPLESVLRTLVHELNHAYENFYFFKSKQQVMREKTKVFKTKNLDKNNPNYKSIMYLNDISELRARLAELNLVFNKYLNPAAMEQLSKKTKVPISGIIDAMIEQVYDQTYSLLTPKSLFYMYRQVYKKIQENATTTQNIFLDNPQDEPDLNS